MSTPVLGKCLALLIAVLVLAGGAGDSSVTAEQHRWFSSFANDPTMQNQTALIAWQQKRHSDALYWWQRAAQNGSQQALINLQNHFPEQQQRWLLWGVEQGNPQAIAKLATIALADRQVSWEQWLKRWYRPDSSSFKQALNRWYSDVALWVKPQQSNTCRRHVKVYGDNAGQKRQFLALLTELPKSTFAQLGWCFSFHVTSPARDGRGFQVILSALGGKAYAEPHRIHLTRDSDSRVLAHEMGHWLGLADEYAMAPKLAQAFCQGRYRYQATNIVLTSSSVMSASELQQLWRQLPWRNQVADWQALGQPLREGLWQLGSATEASVGLFKADTCDAVAGVTAWKPTARVTAMEDHKTAYWPKWYPQLFRRPLPIKQH